MIIANELDEVKKPGRGGVTSGHRSREILYFKYNNSAEENRTGSLVIHYRRKTLYQYRKCGRSVGLHCVQRGRAVLHLRTADRAR
jgi:hypothetical protein